MTVEPLVLPAYGRASLTDLVPSAAAMLAGPSGAGLDGNLLNLPRAARMVLLLVDGLGQRQLDRNAADAPYLCSLPRRTLTCGVPSTTATSLTSLGVGLPPGEHGVVGYTSRIPGTDRLLNALRWDESVDAEEWQPHPTALAAAARAGVATTVVNKRAFEGTGLTVASQRGVEFVAADSAGERLAAAARIAAADTPSLVYIYDSDLDATGHARGCRSEAWRHQLATVDAFAQRLREVIPADAALVVTADHGMVDVGPEGRIDVDAEPDLMDGVSLLGGEARFRHVYCRAGAVDDVAARWRERLGADALVLTREQAIAAGWFGSVRSGVEPRLGDVVVACLGPVAVVSSERFPFEAMLVGLHGSLTAEEMYVPLLVDAPRGAP
ncbi:MAG: alkaline phosphatase family protein [Actinomycetota bacterium]|nr:alkaline phosphatase family protein [Actinomycetota bacterium]